MFYLPPPFILLVAFIVIQLMTVATVSAAVNAGKAPLQSDRKVVDSHSIRKILSSKKGLPIGKPQATAFPAYAPSAPSEQECIADPIHFQQWMNARLETSDCVMETGQYFDVFYFEALAGEQVDIHMYENWFDTVLFLADESGDWVISDDDSGGNNAARIVAKVPETGIYIIIASSYYPAMVSNYNLILRGGPSCSYDISPPSAVVPPEGGTFTFNVKTQPRCYFQSRASNLYADQNSLTATGEGLETGTVTYQVTANPRNQERHGGITVAPIHGVGFNITQRPKVCSYSFDPAPPLAFGPFETTSSFRVHTQSGCSWNAVGAFNANGGSPNGDGNVQLQIQHNNGPDRSGFVRIDNAIFNITQTGLNCAYSIAPTNDRFLPARGIEGYLNIETQPECTWGINRNQNWIEIERGLFKGPKTLPFRILPLAEPDDRTGVIQFNYSLGWENGGYKSIFFDQQPKQFSAQSDLDGDGISDIAVYEPETGKWQSLGSLRTVPDMVLGTAADKPVPADYDGDGKTDPAVFTPSSGRWTILTSSNGQMRELMLGGEGDIPVQDDYDGDGKADPAVYTPSDSRWTIEKSLSGRTEVFFGTVDSLPVPGDWDRDGKVDLAVFNRTNSQWELSTSLSGPTTFTFGSTEDFVFAANYGSGFVQPSYYRPSTGEWRVRNIPWGNEFTLQVPFVGGAEPVIGDFDGNGVIDPAIYDPATGNWHIRLSNLSIRTANLGGPGFLPLSGRVFAPQSQSPTTISGQAISSDGRGLRNVLISLVGPDDSMTTVITSSLGYFKFENVSPGQYTIRAVSKRYRFASQEISHSDDLTQIQMTGIE